MVMRYVLAFHCCNKHLMQSIYKEERCAWTHGFGGLGFLSLGLWQGSEFLVKSFTSFPGQTERQSPTILFEASPPNDPPPLNRAKGWGPRPFGSFVNAYLNHNKAKVLFSLFTGEGTVS